MSKVPAVKSVPARKARPAPSSASGSDPPSVAGGVLRIQLSATEVLEVRIDIYSNVVVVPPPIRNPRAQLFSFSNTAFRLDQQLVQTIKVIAP